MSFVIREITALSRRRLQRWHLLELEEEDRITLKEAAKLMGLSWRHARRLKEKVAQDGLVGLVHGNRGRKPANGLDEQIRERTLELIGSMTAISPKS